MSRIRCAAAIVAMMFVPACSTADPTRPAAQPTPAPTTAAMPAGLDVYAQQTCDLVKPIISADPDEMMTSALGPTINNAAQQSGHAEIKTAAAQVWSRYSDAVLAQGESDEFAAEANLMTAVLKLQTVCIEAGSKP